MADQLERGPSSVECWAILGLEIAFDAAVGDEPDDGDGDEADPRNPRTDEGKRDCRNVNGDGDFAFAVAADGNCER